ncbi:hypothetical protein, partial [Paracoccus sp. AS002]
MAFAVLIIPEGELNAFSAIARNTRAKFNDRGDIAPAVLINVFNPGLIVSFADILIALMLLISAIENLNAVRKLPPILLPNRGDLKRRDTNLRRQISNNLADARLRLCCTNRVRDSCRESRVVAGMHEQTH